MAPNEVPNIAPEVSRLADGKVARGDWRFRRKDVSIFPDELETVKNLGVKRRWRWGELR